MESQPTFKSLFEDAGDYLETRVDLLKLKAIHTSSDVTSSIVSRVAVLLILLFAVLILNIGSAMWVGELIGTTYLGFFVVAGFYLLIALVLHFFSHSWIKEPVSTMIIKKMLK